MTRAFTEDQRALVREALLNEGRHRFIEGGLSEISLSRLSEAAGVAKTSFYAFFPSKEHLLLDLLGAEAPGVSARVMALLADPLVPAPEALSKFLHAMLAEYRANAFLARLIREPQTLEAMARRVRAEDLERKTNWVVRPIAAFFTSRIATGELAPRPIRTLMDVIRSVLLLSLHRDQFGNDERFEAATRMLIELVTTGLIKQETSA